MGSYARILIWMLSIFFLLVSSGYGAQSSGDVTVTRQLLESTRIKIMGGKGKTMPRNEEYIIGHGDVLHVSIYGEGSMSAAARASAGTKGEDGKQKKSNLDGITVRLDGRISLSYIGDVEVVGMTLTQLADYLKELFRTAFDDPIVTTVLLESNSRRYTVMGKVLKPGVFLIDFPISLVQAIARCGGFTEWANSKITVVRQKASPVNGKLFRKNTLKFDYDDFLDGKGVEKNITIQPDDIIIVH